MSELNIALSLARPAFVFMMIVGLMVIVAWMERKGAALIQGRLGPGRARLAGLKLGGLMHVIADSIKLLVKEEVAPRRAARPLFFITPAIGLAAVLAAAAAIPFTGDFSIAGVQLSVRVAEIGGGLVYAIAISSLGVYSIMLAGYSSMGTYTMLGGMRAAAQMISYGLGLGLSAAAVFIVAGSLEIGDIVADQGGAIWMWNAFRQPVAFAIFLTALFAWAGRVPFDPPKAAEEIVGYHAEYSGTRFSLFLMAEYAYMVVGSAMAAAIFLGGWQIPFVSEGMLESALNQTGLAAWMVQVAIGAVELSAMLLKTLAICALFIWVRWTLPRFRYDQMMAFGWKFLLPLAMLNAAITAFAVLKFRG